MVTLEGSAQPGLKAGVLPPTLNVSGDGLVDLIAHPNAVDASHLPEHLLVVGVEPQGPCHDPDVTGD